MKNMFHWAQFDLYCRNIFLFSWASFPFYIYIFVILALLTELLINIIFGVISYLYCWPTTSVLCVFFILM